MSAIKSFSNEKTISGAIELPIGGESSRQYNSRQMTTNKNIPFYQEVAKKLADIFERNIEVKSEGKWIFMGATDEPKPFCFTELMLPILQTPSWNTTAISFQDVMEPETQIETLLELGDEIELCDQHEQSRDYELFNDEVPLLNMSGTPQVPNNNIVHKPKRLLMSSVKEEGNSLELPIIGQIDNQTIVNPLLLKPASKGDFFANKPLAVLENKYHQVDRATLPPSVIKRLTTGMQESKQVIEHSNLIAVGQGTCVNVQPEIIAEVLETNSKSSPMAAATGHDITATLGSVITQERVRQNLTKSEKKPPVLQENEDIDIASISRSSSAPKEIGAQTLAQTLATSESSSVASQVGKWIAVRAATDDFHIKETLPRTLTYTFHQWKNTPSVTFELATKTEFIATTQSREVQQTLLENKHLLSGEKNIYFRQDQEHGQQHRQQQEQHQQEED
ncbi:SpaN/EivJ family type III secretion system needle length determinant [Providencia sp. Me31A]|uniref:SpaN/EivJ family type III secretion system needle length determinant n=1 Tax=Providencia sp. Me31A TaxID=3392637 RepID=UPI003D2ABF16